MAEIKSTLDLVMERTRHLTLTEEEKREYALAQFKGSLNGLLQKYLDGVLNLERTDKEIRRLQEESGFKDRSLLVDEVSRRLDLDGDYRPLLDLLTELCNVDTGKIASLFTLYRDTIASEAEARADRAKERLERRDIAGTAVVPNLGADPQWTEERDKIREKFTGELAHQVSRLLT
jgi:hypothetical protein